jgi:hypothetical protein
LCIRSKERQECRVDGNLEILPGFPADDFQPAVFEIDVAPFQRLRFGLAQARATEEFREVGAGREAHHAGAAMLAFGDSHGRRADVADDLLELGGGRDIAENLLLFLRRVAPSMNGLCAITRSSTANWKILRRMRR